MRKDIVLLLIVSTGLTIGAVIATSFHMKGTSDWPMFRHDVHHTGAADCTVENELQLMWRYKTEDAVDSSPAVVDGYVYVGSNDDHVYCLTDTGELVWRYKTGDDVWSSPAVVDGYVYFGSGDNHMYCLTDTGELVWKYDTGVWIASSPAVAYGKVYIGARNICLYCVDAATGALVWAYDVGQPYIRVRSSPTIANDTVYFGSYVFPCCNSYFYCLDVHTGELVWWYETGSEVLYGSPAAAYGNVYIGSGNNYVYCFTDAGDLLWVYETGDDVASSPAVADGKVYVGSYDHNFYCLDAYTGEMLQKFKTGHKIARSSPTIADGKLYVGSYDSYVYCFGTDAGTSHVLPTEAPSSSSPTPPGATSVTPPPSTAPAPRERSWSSLIYVGSFLVIGIAVILFLMKKHS